MHHQSHPQTGGSQNLTNQVIHKILEYCVPHWKGRSLSLSLYIYIYIYIYISVVLVNQN